MGFGKSFLLSLVAFVGLNFIFILIVYLITGFNDLIDEIQNAPLMIIYYLFGAVASTPSWILDRAIVQPVFFIGDLSVLIIALGYLVSSLVAAILAGKFAESKFQGFGGWALTVIVSTVAMIFGIIPGWSSTFVSTLNLYYGWSGFEVTLVYLIISCVVNILCYGFFALLVSKTEYY